MAYPVQKGVEFISNLLGSGVTKKGGGSVFLGTKESAPEMSSKQLIAGYKTFPWLRMVIDKISELSGEMEWHVGKVTSRTEDGEERIEIVPDHPLAKLLNNGNSEFSGLVMRQLAFKEMCILGEFAWIKQRNNAGDIAELWPIPTTWIKELPIENENGNYKLEIQGQSAEIAPRNVIYIRIPNPENPYLRGAAPAAAVSDELSIDEVSSKYVKQFFFNSARPDLLIYSEDDENPINPEDAERLEETWLAKLRSFTKAHRPFFLPGKVGVKDISSKLSELDVGNLRRFSRDTILSMYGLPPEALGIIESCLDTETECLTRRGWVTQNQLTEADEIATWNEDKGRVEYHCPKQVLRFDHDGPMHYWVGGHVDFVCTPNHRLWVRHGRRRGERDGWEFRFSDEVKDWTSARWRVTGGDIRGTKTTVQLPATYHGSATRHLNPDTPKWRKMPVENPAVTVDVEDFAGFLGSWLAEGWLCSQGNSVFFSQNEGPKAEAMYHQMDGLGLGTVYSRERPCITTPPGSTSPSKNVHFEYRLNHKGLHTWLDENCGKYSHTKRIPDEVFEWPITAQQALFDALIDGDGTRKPLKSGKEAIRFASVSQKLVDDVQRLCVHLGYRAHKTDYASNYPGGKRMYHLTISQRSYYQAVDKYGDSWVTESNYKGIVWCVEVENQRFFTRRNGRVACHGNSNRATITAAEFFLTKHVVTPKLKFLKAELERTLVKDFENSENLRLIFENPVVEDAEMQAELVKSAPWAFEVNEIRKIAQFQPEEGEEGKVRALPVNMTFTNDLLQSLNQEPDEEDIKTMQLAEEIARRISNNQGKQ